ncbi:hypothetical protein ACTFIV_008012 [Dictyostelium citrinum]
MLKTNSLIISIFFLIFTLSSVAKSSNYLYSITYSNTPNSWQLIKVFDVLKKTQICSAQIQIEYQIQSIINIRKNEIILLGTSGEKEAMILFDIKTQAINVLSEIDNGAIFEIKQNTQPLVFTDKTAVSVGLIDSDTKPSIVERNFSNNNMTNTTLNLFYYNGDNYIAPPLYTYSESKDTMYVLYQTNKHPIQNGTIAVFPRSNPNIIDFSYNVEGLIFNNTIMIFTNPQGKLFAVNTNDWQGIEICEINLLKAKCEIITLVTVGLNYLGQGYTPAFLSFDGSKLILVGNIETSSTPFFVLDTIKWTKSMFMVPYTWNDETLSTYSFFNYL